MLEHINIDVLMNLVVMLRASVEGAILLSDDEEESRFYEGIAHDQARVIPATNSALALLRMMEMNGIQGLAAVVRGAKQQPNAPNVFQSFFGDSTSLLLISKGCESVMRDICGTSWLTACKQEVGPIGLRVVWLARILDQIQRLCTQHGQPTIEKMDTHKIIDWGRFELSWPHLMPILLDNHVPQSEFERLRAIQPGSDLRTGLLECDGRVAVHIMSVATSMYRPRGIAASKQIDANGLVGMLRVAFDPAEFEKDEVFWRVRLWERANRGYPLLRQWRLLEPLGVILDQRYWETDLATMISMLRPTETLTMFKMDLDEFKRVNETLGHACGDEAIRLYCKIVKKVLGATCEVYRRGGDELVALAPGIGEMAARELAEKTRVEIEASFRTWAVEQGLDCGPTASIGIALGTAAQSGYELSQLADKAQKQAKQHGKNQVIFLRF